MATAIAKLDLAYAQHVASSPYLAWRLPVERLFAMVLLVIATPLLLVVIVLVRATSAGAAIYRQTGELFAVYARDHENVPAAWNRESGLSFAGDRIRGFVRVVEAGVPIGAVYLDVHYNLYGRLVQFSGILIIVLLGALLLAVFLSAALQRSITRPIQDITEAARRVIERHDYSVRVPKRGEDETALRHLVQKHYDLTGSAVAERLLGAWKESVRKFVRVMPVDYARVLEQRQQAARPVEERVSA